MATATNELRLKVGTQVVTILTNKDHPRGYCRLGGIDGPLHMLVALSPNIVGLLRISLSIYEQFREAAKNLPPAQWEFEVTCYEVDFGLTKVPVVRDIKPVEALVLDVSKQAAEAFQELATTPFVFE